MPSHTSKWEKQLIFLIPICTISALFSILFLLSSENGSCKGPSEWASRSIYSIMTDRFSPTNVSDSDTCPQGKLLENSYCGGTFQGIINHLDYIQGMGFDAIWISPIIENAPHGYHGYWPLNLDKVNSHFSSEGSSEGAERDLKSLIRAAHAREIYVMLDAVPNHMGGPTTLSSPYTDFHPFNESTHYHQVCHLRGLCNPNKDEYFCTVPLDAYSMNYTDTLNGTICQEKDQVAIEMCHEAPGLLDLNQSNSFVRNELLQRLQHDVKHYGFDGVRVDSFKHVPIPFWRDYKESTSCFVLGEVSTPDPCFLAPYEREGAAHGLMSYPMSVSLRSVFGDPPRSMTMISDQLHAHKSEISNLGLFGSFVDNHDQDRFHTVNPNPEAAKNALTYVFLGEGIPIVYYGTEQGYEGKEASQTNRDPLWWSSFDTTHPLYKFIALLNRVRKKYQVWKYKQEEIFSAQGLYVFTRGPLLVVLTNQKHALRHSVPQGKHRLKPKDKLCDCLRPEKCETVQADGSLSLQVFLGEPSIYARRHPIRHSPSTVSLL